MQSSGRSTVDVLFCVDEVQETILVLVLFINFFKFGADLDQMLFIGKEYEALFSSKWESLAKNWSDLSNGEVLGHHKSSKERRKVGSVWTITWLLEKKSRDIQLINCARCRKNSWKFMDYLLRIDNWFQTISLLGCSFNDQSKLGWVFLNCLLMTLYSLFYGH